jgi:hypothetical protein
LHTLSISSPFSGSNGCFLIDFGFCLLAVFRGKELVRGKRERVPPDPI